MKRSAFVRPQHSALLACALSCVLACTGALAQDQRDPTRAPALPSAAGAADGAPALPVSPGNTSVVMREGKPYLVVGTRLVAVGQNVEGFRLERITETEVWLRQGKALHKVARFGGIERRAVVACQNTAPAPGASSNGKAAARKPANQASQKSLATASSGASAAGPRPNAATAATSSNAAPCESSSP